MPHQGEKERKNEARKFPQSPVSSFEKMGLPTPSSRGGFKDLMLSEHDRLFAKDACAIPHAHASWILAPCSVTFHELTSPPTGSVESFSPIP